VKGKISNFIVSVQFFVRNASCDYLIPKGQSHYSITILSGVKKVINKVYIKLKFSLQVLVPVIAKFVYDYK
jgi:hypothetical protein